MCYYYGVDFYETSSTSSPLVDESPLLSGSSGWSDTMGSVTLHSKTSVFLTSSGKSSELSSVVLLGNDPVDSWVLSDGVVSWVNEDDLEVFIGGILSNPVRVKNSHVGASSTDLLFSNRSVGSGFLELSNTKMDGLTVNDTLMDCSLSSSSSDSDSVDGISLLLFESEGSSLVQSGWSGGFMADGKLSVLPASDSHDESEDIRLLLSPKFL